MGASGGTVRARARKRGRKRAPARSAPPSSWRTYPLRQVPADSPCSIVWLAAGRDGIQIAPAKSPPASAARGPPSAPFCAPREHNLTPSTSPCTQLTLAPASCCFAPGAGHRSRGNQQPPGSLSGLPLGEAGATRRHRQQLEQRDTLAASLPARAWHPQCCPRAAAPAACRCSRYGAWPRQHTGPPAVPADLTDAPARRPLARPPQDIFDVVEIDPTGKKFDKGTCAPRNAWIGRRV